MYVRFQNIPQNASRDLYPGKVLRCGNFQCLLESQVPVMQSFEEKQKQTKGEKIVQKEQQVI